MAIWTRIPLVKLATNRYKIAISLKELTEKSNDFSKKYVGGCTPVLIKSDPKKLFMQYRVTCTKEDSDPKGHEVRILFDISKVTSESNIGNLDTRVSCSCPAFLYWAAQWNTNEEDALEGTPRPLLQAPTERLDLRSNYLVCKHIHVVAKRIGPAVSNVINRIKDKIRLERVRQSIEEEKRIKEEEVSKLEGKKPAKTPPKKPKPSVEHRDMGQSKPSRTRPGVIR